MAASNDSDLTIKVRTGSPYSVHIGRGLLAEVGTFAAGAISPCRVAVVTDDIVDALYGDAVCRSLEKSGFTPAARIVFPHGERSKTLGTFCRIIDKLAAAGLTRSDCVAALGGGVVGDVAGFAAACYARGIRYVQIPTTLLAMTDSSVGGKTAVDLAAGKNLCGAFHQPSVVVIDTDTLESLPQEHVADGLGEIAKYAAGFDAGLLTHVRNWSLSAAPSAVARCVGIKAAVVEEDEHDTGERQKLNLGHTAAHAIERLAAFGVTHGRAVASGTVIMARAASRRGWMPAEDARAVETAIRGAGLPVPVRWTPAELASAASSDKKRRGAEITLVVPTSLGTCDLMRIRASELEGVFADGMKDMEPLG